MPLIVTRDTSPSMRRRGRTLSGRLRSTGHWNSRRSRYALSGGRGSLPLVAAWKLATTHVRLREAQEGILLSHSLCTVQLMGSQPVVSSMERSL